jgi:hypothetical protein
LNNQLIVFIVAIQTGYEHILDVEIVVRRVDELAIRIVQVIQRIDNKCIITRILNILSDYQTIRRGVDYVITE